MSKIVVFVDISVPYEFDPCEEMTKMSETSSRFIAPGESFAVEFVVKTFCMSFLAWFRCFNILSARIRILTCMPC